jgi:hypothetical protein
LKIDNSQNQLCGGLYTCKSGTFCRTPIDVGLSLSADQVENNPLMQYGILHFDNVGIAILSIFRVVTLEGWATVMYNYMDSVGYSSAIYFPILVLIGSFFLLNLFLAVIMETFIEMTETMK